MQCWAYGVGFACVGREALLYSWAVQKRVPTHSGCKASSAPGASGCTSQPRIGGNRGKGGGFPQEERKPPEDM